MNITLLCSDSQHPVNSYLHRWAHHNQDAHRISHVSAKGELPGGEILFLISCSEVLTADERGKYDNTLVLHASDLPRGRGWSPHIWSILEGREEITVSLLEAEDRVDVGRIWQQCKINIPAHALWDEINDALFSAEVELMDYAVKNITTIKPKAQDTSITATYFPRRTPDDSQLDPEQSIANQFNSIRVCDPARFPAFFELHGHRYKITLEKING